MFHASLFDHADLRVLDIHQADPLFALCDRNRDRLKPYLPWVDRTQSVEDTRQFLALAQRQYSDGNGFHAGIWWKDQLAGCVGMHLIDWMNQSVALGYWIDRDFEGRGLVTAACRRVVEESFSGYKLHRVEIRCAADNVRSCAVAERLGFRREGLLREAQKVGERWLDMTVFGKLVSDL
jgi:ribosomal-protein-serine acetyltransferase